MKTIVVIFTDVKVDKADTVKFKKYSFNTANALRVGDIIQIGQYNSNVQVVKVLTKAHKFYNKQTGEISNEYVSTMQEEIKTLKLRDEDDTVVYGTLKRK